MDQRDDVLSDMTELANSLRRKFDNLYPLSDECCIYRVDEPRRCLNPSDYTPKLVSIGPLHHGKAELKAMEKHKLRYLKQFFQRTQVSIENFLLLIKDKETKLRSCYAETIEHGSGDFVRMILVDAVFLIELFLRQSCHSSITSDDRIFRNPWMDVWRDLWLEENQLPFFTVEELLNLYKGDTDEGLSLIKITHQFRAGVLGWLSIDNNLLDTQFSGAKHFLDWLSLCLQKCQSSTRTILKPQAIPSAMELHQAGVKFIKSESNKTLLDITFNKGILKIPFLTVYDDTEYFYRNLLAFESMHSNTSYFSDYIIMMSYLANTPKDAELLVQNGVVGLGNSERFSNVFRSLIKECLWDYNNFQYSGVVEDLQTYCRYPCNKWKATLKQNYFNTPWAFISFMAAVILLLLTFIQTLCSLPIVEKRNK